LILWEVRFGALPQTPLKNFLKEVFKNFKNFEMSKTPFSTGCCF